VKRKRIEEIVREFLVLIGENPERKGLKQTPRLVAEFVEEIFLKKKEPKDILKKYYAEHHEGIIGIKDIPFYSFCEHHLLPFFGKVGIAYIPKENIVAGFGDVVSLVQVLSRRLQLQERLTKDIADIFTQVISPQGMLVKIEAEHLCVLMQKEKKERVKTVTYAWRGVMKDEKIRKEALQLLK